MSITVEEKYFSRTRDKTLVSVQTEREFLVRGSTDDKEIEAAVEAETPVTLEEGALVRVGIHVDPIGIDGPGDEPNVWEATVRYGSPGMSFLNGDGDFTFETAGGTTHIKASLATVAAYGTGTSPGDNGNLIGATADGVEGVDIASPVFNFTETHLIPAANVTAAYKQALFNLTARVNNAPFRGFAAGEVLFLGATGRQISDELWEITFHFAASPNATGLSVGSIGGIAKKGWEYLWVKYLPIGLPDAEILTQEPRAVYVERVYHDGDFSTLGIGT